MQYNTNCIWRYLMRNFKCLVKRNFLFRFTVYRLYVSLLFNEKCTNFYCLIQVCEEQGCQEEVYSLAMNYMDRFLCVCSIQRTQLQLLGSACLLLASKLREPSSRGLPPDVLVFYTENSITLRDLIVSKS